MPIYLANLSDWSSQNGMQFSTSKPKEMILGPLTRTNTLPLTFLPGTVERVNTFTY